MKNNLGIKSVKMKDRKEIFERKILFSIPVFPFT